MLSRYVKFAASTMLTPHSIGSLAVVIKDRHCLRLINSKPDPQESDEKSPEKCKNVKNDESKKHETEEQKSPSESTNDNNNILKVTVLGANGQVGQILSLFLKQCPLIGTLSLYDINPICGTALDISHIDTSCRVYAYTGGDRLTDALKDSDIVIMTAGVSQTPNMSKGQLFYKNAEIAHDLTQQCCKACPKALIAVLTNPINSIVPVVCEVLKKNGCFESNRVFGVSAAHVVRANTLVAKRMSLDPTGVIVPIIGGNSAHTLVPVLSQTKPCFGIPSPFFTEEVFTYLMCRIRNSASEVVSAKEGTGTPTLCVAYSTACFIHSLAKGLSGKQAIECAYVFSDVIPSCNYLITPIELGRNGILRNFGLPKLTNFEQALFNEAVPSIINDIKLGTEFVNSPGDCN